VAGDPTPSTARLEDAALLTGSATFVADVRRAGQLHLVVVRSQAAHGRVRSIDVSEALGSDGVVAVLTARDVISDLGDVPTIRARLTAGVAVDPWLQPVIATDRVRYVGEPVAVVVATTPYAAEDAAELVFPDIDPLPPSPHLRTLGTPPLHAAGDEVTTLEARIGDVVGAFAQAPVVVEAEVRIGRHTGMPMETRGLVAEPVDDRLVIHGATKVVHWNRQQLADHLSVSPDSLVFRETAVGGGFGVRGEYYPEDFLVPWVAQRLGRPVRWIEDRREHMVATNHAREQVHVAAMAGDRDGRILGLRSEFWVDLGAYVRTNGVRPAENTLAMLPGPYDIPAYGGTAHLVLTSRTPTGTYRAPGRAESVHVCEHLLERYAHAIDADPADVRRRNLIARARMPYTRAFTTGPPATTFTDGDYQATLARVTEAVDVPGVAARRARGEPVGVSVVPFIEATRLGPKEYGCVRLEPDGRLRVRSGASSVGQGTRTMLATVAARVFDVAPAAVDVEFLDTAHVPRGWGSYASRSTAMAGSAVHLAARDLADRVRQVVAESWGVRTEDVRVEDGRVIVGPGSERLTLAQVATMAPRDDGPLTAEVDFASDVTINDIGAHGAVVRVDTLTGGVTVERLVVAFDTGTVINRQLVEGQLLGAAVQGIGSALLEQFLYDEDANPQATSFVDYLLPTVSEVPALRAIMLDEVPSSSNPLGVKGVGEAGITGAMAAIVAAVGQAVGDPTVGERTPVDLEAVLRAARRWSR
jgi:carbon-monoxide dehydrogenase large subunit